jgi:electron transfer flavoprotein alpha subunit
MHSVLVLAEVEEGYVAPITFGLLKVGAEISARGREGLYACVVGHGVNTVAEELACYARKVFVRDDPSLADFDPDRYASVLGALCTAVDPAIVIMGHTWDNQELAAKVACRLGGEAVMDCVKMEREEETGRLLCAKQIYGGHAVAVIRTEAEPQIVTVRPSATDPERDAEGGEIIPFGCDIAPSSTRRIALVRGESVSLEKANAIVGGGRGIRTAEGLRRLEELVGALKKHFENVELGGSRALVDAGLVSHSRQIGQTGEKIGPRLYIAVAISGASQHTAGIGDTKTIVAINKDADAPIFECADYGLVGTYEDMVPELVRRLGETGCR